MDEYLENHTKMFVLLSFQSVSTEFIKIVQYIICVTTQSKFFFSIHGLWWRAAIKQQRERDEVQVITESESDNISDREVSKIG